MKLLVTFGCIFSLILFGCSRPLSQGGAKLFGDESLSVIPETLNEENIWTYTVDSYLDPTYGNYIKFSLELDESGSFKTIIWHPNTFPYHADYLSTLSAYSGLTRTQIDNLSLYNKTRKILLGTALAVKKEDYTLQGTEWDIQFIGVDHLPVEQVAKAIALVKANLPRSEKVTTYYLPSPEQLLFAESDRALYAGFGIELARREAAPDKVCYANGWGAGYVRILDEDQLAVALKEGSISSDEILVLKSIPHELPPVAGIIVGSPSSPSSHPALLAQMLNVPFFYEKDVQDNVRWRELSDSREPVYFEAKGTPGGSCEVLVRDGKALTPDDLSRLQKLKKPSPLKLEPFVDLSSDAPLALRDLGMKDAKKVGAKAANVAELMRLIPNNTLQGGLAVPVSAFAHFIKDGKTESGESLNDAYQEIMLQLSNSQLSLRETIPLLARLRKLIEKAQIPDEMASTFLKEIEGTFPQATRIKLRSSSNVEDLPEFNGAGLYESKGACVGDDKGRALCETKPDPVLKALKGVWASLYTMKAWVARKTFGIDEAAVGMGVLIQRSYQDELANGVAIASYPEGAYFGDGNIPAIQVLSSGFPGEDDSVTNPPPGKIPETVRIQGEWKEVLTSSTELPRGRPLLSPEAYKSLYSLIDTIFRHYEKELKPKDLFTFALDLEWKLVTENGEERIVIKQVRPVPSPTQSTMGLGFGSYVVGESSALLCPTIQEDTDSLSKLKLSMPMTLSLGLHEIPMDAGDEIANPLRQLRIEGVDIALSAKAKVFVKEDWSPLWGSSQETRTLAIQTPFEKDNQTYLLSWNLRQTRSTLGPRRLIDGVQSSWTLDFDLSQGEKRLRYAMVLGQSSCHMDAYQGIQPGSYLASASFSAHREEPHLFEEGYESVGDQSLHIDLKARTAFQGFDKTRFLGIDEVTIKGLLTKPLLLKKAAVYAPGHHNFQWSYAFDLTQAEGLTNDDRKDLAAKGYKYLMIDYFEELFVFEPFVLKPNEEFLPPEPKAPDTVIYALNDAGVKVDLGLLKRTYQTNPYRF